MGHLGLTLQAVAALGGYKVQANSVEQATMLRKDAKRCEAAGVLCLWWNVYLISLKKRFQRS
ncbi:3-methyl-2-oxobutanoate hydroxymethyltransferase [Virgibacillus pantothenticus]|nr:3-methyl-2-oxobutanoate hydroxymethyltransferase [Virgibacillus pantothenticus]MBU8600871.1 3-methyl-2-oxobutanoate hydroxymethyltransferase [Virgibacillus pantothenticus]MBU8635249.1 3-methyl-2-oxobutanoate hydroxymethyltransferase [Virgibacillus pantothenticus]MBU8642948.1 3-methyl-2-oxobutanoate hydroxymethyltransferase [Virgibacillus pantothenticus]MBU8647031.1 3-methyl-2-oxobutanoate hydroxymethyltransferase [Virgibacillus pantothenticus]